MTEIYLLDQENFGKQMAKFIKLSTFNSNENEENLEQQIDRLNHLIVHLAGRYNILHKIIKYA